MAWSSSRVTWRDRHTWMLVAAIAMMVLVNNCNSPLWTAIKKINNANVKAWLVDNLTAITNWSMTWFGCTDALSYAITAAAAYFLSGKKTHPVDFLVMGAVMFLANGFEKRGGKTLVYVAAVACAVVLHLGILPSDISGIGSIDYHNCTA